MRALALFWLAVTLLVLTVAPEARSHYRPGVHNVWHASLYGWCGGNNFACLNGRRAFDVAWCESRFNRWASNGQYLGLWQMGSSERARCGQVWGRDPWTQARAAACWWRLAGWSAWACA